MRYPPEFIDKVQETSSLLDIISQYTQLKSSGAGFRGAVRFQIIRKRPRLSR